MSARDTEAKPMMKFPAVLAGALAVMLFASVANAQFAGRPSLLSKSASGDPANSPSWGVDVSGDGRFTVFASDADNLVPLDENEDSDIFLYDELTQILTRVSVNFQGEEATGDSSCPSISADGRFVAFASNAWNMAPGGTHVVDPVWDTYLLDRQGPTLMRLSVPIGGGLGSDHSYCPKVSANGNRVAFSSWASDLVPGDTNGIEDVFVYDVPSGTLSRVSVGDDESEGNDRSFEPVLSADGNVVAFFSYATNLTSASPPPHASWRGQVYARDIAAGTTELVSRAFGGPLLFPNGGSCCPQISDDGTEILFRSRARNLGSTHGSGDWSVYVHDRTDGSVEIIESLSVDTGTCRWASPFACRIGETDAAVMSGDGRFVAFLSSSWDLLPENLPNHFEQIFVQDRLTRRLRRVTVDETGYPTFSYTCGGSSSSFALSGDGSVLAFLARDSSEYGLPATGTGRDAVRLDLTCEPHDEGCRQISVCPGTPLDTCESAEKSRLRIRRNPPLSSRRDRLYWRWIGPGEGSGQAFVDPQGAQYQLCAYAGDTMNAAIDAGIPQDGAWKSFSKGWRLKDDGAVGFVRLRTSSKRRTAKIVTSSPAIDLPYLPLDAPNGVKMQLQELTTGRCWEADFDPSTIDMNRRGEITGGGVTSGAVRADLD